MPKTELIKQDVLSLIAQFKQILDYAEDFDTRLDNRDDVVFGGIKDSEGKRIEALINEYEDARTQFTKIITQDMNSKIELPSITQPKRSLGDMVLSDAMGQIVKLKIASKKAIGFLESVNFSPNMPKEQIDHLESLRKELKEMDIEVNYERNLTFAIEELESGHFLASSLISSRVIDRCMDAIPGEKDGDKIDFLVKNSTVKNDEKDVKSSILKAARLARNVLTHDLDIPTPKEAFSLLADGFKLAEIVSKMKLKVAANP